jgi:MFS family permease
LPLVGATRPWQVVFFIVGLPGILLALLMYTVREPARRGTRLVSNAEGKRVSAKVPMKEVTEYLWQNRATFICHNVGFALLSFSSYGSSAWIPTFFVRNHGLTEAQAGQLYGWIVAIFGTIQQMMPNAMRGQASAIYLFVVNLIGLGLGPTAVAMSTDYIFGDDQAVNYSLLLVNMVAHLIAAVLLWVGIQPFLNSLNRLKDWTASQA